MNETEKQIDEMRENLMKAMLSNKQREMLETRFTHHPPKGDQAERYTTLRAEAFQLAGHILLNTPESREQSLALTKLEEAVMWANAAIARNE